jgi:DNA-binding GntR family transcriptional regulator
MIENSTETSHDAPQKQSIPSSRVKSTRPTSTMIKLAKVPNLTELTYRSIKQNLLDGTLGELSRLTEESLATQLGISKSPVREALNRLEAEGLVCIEPRRGAYVRQFSAKEIRDLYELREILEVHSIEGANVTPKLLGELAASINRTKKHLKDGNKLEHIEEDMRFHRMITAATGNDELCRVLENIQQKTLLCRSKSYELSATTAPVAHAKIYQALKKDSKREARAAMRDHIVFVRERLLGSFKTSS